MLRRRLIGLVLLAGMLSAVPAQAVVVYDNATGNTADPGVANGDLGWNYVGSWSGTKGNGSGVAIAPHAFLTALHIGGETTNIFNLNGNAYHVASGSGAVTQIAGSDLEVVHVVETFDSYAPLASSVAAGDTIAIVGYGPHTHGDEVVTGGTSNGWLNAAPGKSWGENVVDSANAPANTLTNMIQFDFDASTNGGIANEGILAPGDSGGGVFVFENGQWELAGINYAISQFYTKNDDNSYTALGVFPADVGASVYDTSGLYINTNSGGSPEYKPADSLEFQLSNEQAFASNVVNYRNDILSLVSLPVPEPASLLLLAPAALLFTRRRPIEGVRA